MSTLCQIILLPATDSELQMADPCFNFTVFHFIFKLFSQTLLYDLVKVKHQGVP